MLGYVTFYPLSSVLRFAFFFILCVALALFESSLEALSVSALFPVDPRSSFYSTNPIFLPMLFFFPHRKVSGSAKPLNIDVKSNNRLSDSDQIRGNVTLFRSTIQTMFWLHVHSYCHYPITM